LKNLIFIVILTAVLAAAGCSSATENANTTVNSAPANEQANAAPVEPAVTEPFKPSENPKDDLLDSTRRLQAHDYWAATLENSLMPDMKAELEYVKPDRYHIKNPEGEIIIIGSSAYARENDGWEKLPADLGAEINRMRQNFNTAGALDSIGEVKKTGTETVDGKEATIYAYSLKEDALPVKNLTRVWIANDTGLPLKIVVETENADQKQTVTTKYDYTKTVKIEAPEVKEAK
jgi:hypothetical protein